MDTQYTCFRAEHLQVDRPKGTTLADGPLMAHMLPICQAKSHCIECYEAVRLAAERLASQRAPSNPCDLYLSAAEGYSAALTRGKMEGQHIFQEEPRALWFGFINAA